MADEGIECFGSEPGQRRAWFPIDGNKEGNPIINYLNIDWESLQPVYDNGNREMLKRGGFVKV